MIHDLLKKTSPDSAEAKLQRRALVLLCVTAMVSAVSDGWLDPPDDGGWHVGTAVFSLFGCAMTPVAAILSLKGRVHLSGCVLIFALVFCSSATFITGTVSSVLITITGTFCLLMVLPQNIFPNSQNLTSSAWPLFLCVCYVLCFMLRMMLRDLDIISYESETPYLFVAGPVFIYLIHTMSERTSTRLRAALDESEGARAEVDEVNTRLWNRSVDLSEALEAANLASEAKGRFLANMSHELRTPLNAILGYAAIIQEELDFTEPGAPLADTLQADLGHIETAGQHLLSLISDVLDLARIEAGQSAIEIERIDLCKLFEEFQSVMKPQVLRRHNVLEISAPEGLMIHTDLIKLRQVLFNLLGNATKFTDRGIITLRATLQGDAHVLFEVADTGKGIPADKHAQLFKAFEQVDSSSTREHGGAGLGLALCAQLVELLGGKISVESAPGKGSTFAFTLPMHPERLDRSALTSTTQATEPEAEPE